MNRSTFLIGAVLGFMAAGTFAAPPLQGEVEIDAASKIEREAGLWLDGQYVGAVGELGGKGRLALVPGQHELLFKLIGHQDVSSTIVVEPGTRQRYRLAMMPLATATYPDKRDTAQLKLDVKPEVAAIFINDSFVGRTDRFGSRHGMRLSAGTYRVTIALPGYEPFNAELTLRAGQTYEIKTELEKGRIGNQAAELTAQRPAPAEER